MRREDLKNWTRDMLKDRIIELGGIIEQWKRDNEKMLQIMEETKKENDELRKRIGKLESGICGGSPCIVSEFHSFEGESWIRATTYDDVLIRLKKANERITDLEQDRFNKSTEELKQVEKLSSENKSLKDENKALKQRIKDLENVCDVRLFLDGKDLIESFKKHIEDDVRVSNIPFDDSEIDYDAMIAELQDQHQQDCIRINDLTTTVRVLAGMYSALRKNVGMD